ncbi:hypothetical protein Clacol_007717 [Clathrus columnatus]|uniref:Copper transport protein n=1 Tax=Clathrus columnatus TaxID=1419009 RepID=A0AAV5AK42_9AGAM|nr:hypothetical protein Clacol_007717 [Clathrus columnatus]
MDMTSDMSSNSTMIAMMKPYLHFTPGDFLYFSTIQPRSNGEMVGACLVLFSLAFIERLLAAYGRISEKKFNDDLIKLSLAHKRPEISQSLVSRARLYPDEKKGDAESIISVTGCAENCDNANVIKPHPVPPFVSRIELKRGLNRAASAFFGYALMLAVMSFNAGFILSIIAGLGVGEMAFGRFAT